MNIINILGVPFNNIKFDDAVNEFLGFLSQDKKNTVFTPNPEFIMAALKDNEFMQILQTGDLTIPDGIGVVIASKILGTPLSERVAGFDLVQAVFDKIKDTEYTVYFLGGAPSVAENAKLKMQQKYKGLKIIGVHDGYFDLKEDMLIVEEINTLKPDIILVGLGFPKQEKWICKNKDILNTKVLMGVGGSFDGMNGNVKRAPDIYIKLNIEWLYRLIKQPSRFPRIMQLPLFLLKVIFTKFKVNKND